MSRGKFTSPTLVEITIQKKKETREKNNAAGLGELFLNNPNYGCLQGGSSHIRGISRFYSERWREREGGREGWGEGKKKEGEGESEADLCGIVGHCLKVMFYSLSLSLGSCVSYSNCQQTVYAIVFVAPGDRTEV